MIDTSKPIAIYMEDGLDSDHGKMGFGLMRYSHSPIICAIDSRFAGKTVREAVGKPYDIPVFKTVLEANMAGAEVLVLGMAPSGGRFPDSWIEPVEQAWRMGMSIINGLHDQLNFRFGNLLEDALPGQIIWDVRQPTFIPEVASAKAATLNNKRVLMVGTDMAAGKMTAGLELFEWIKNKGINAGFIPTGQIGITIMGKGVPLDAVIVDRACGSIETLVMEEADKDIIFIEGQGSLLHPGSTATLPLMRGSCATHLVMCHIAKNKTLRRPTHINMPPMKEFIELNEALTGVCGSLTKAKTIGIALNTFGMTDEEAQREVEKYENETGLPTTDVIRFGAEKIGKELLK